jgi:hypothetical protein
MGGKVPKEKLILTMNLNKNIIKNIFLVFLSRMFSCFNFIIMLSQITVVFEKAFILTN